MKDKDIQQLLGNILRVGVFSALTATVLGGSIYLFLKSGQEANYQNFIQTFHLYSWESISQDMLNYTAIGLIKIGILILVLTPIARVLFSIFAFFIEKDFLYTIISIIVLGIIIFSMSFGFTG